MHRLFVAIRPPQSIRDRLLDVMEGVAGVRWMEDDQLHLTLRFIGEVERHSAEDILTALTAVHQPRFEIALDGLGAFERRGGAKVLWAGVAPHEPLKALHRKIDQAVVRAGLEPERRTFHPHITLARLGRGSGPIQPLIEANCGLSGAPFPVGEFRLYESTLTPARAEYSLVERFPLA